VLIIFLFLLKTTISSISRKIKQKLPDNTHIPLMDTLAASKLLTREADNTPSWNKKELRESMLALT